jgi:hypothetical protein
MRKRRKEMGEDNITFGPGTLYFMNDETGKWEILTDIKEHVCEFVSEEYADEAIRMPIIAGEAFGELTVSMSMFEKLFMNFMLSHCNNPRVVHLAKHSKKKRVRNKNYNRAIKIICKQGDTK